MSRRGRARTSDLPRTMRGARGPALGGTVRVVRPGHVPRLRDPLPRAPALRVVRVAGAGGPGAPRPARPPTPPPGCGRRGPVHDRPPPDDPPVASIGAADRAALGMAARPPAGAPHPH